VTAVAIPGVSPLLLRLTKYGLDPIAVEDTDRYRPIREFCADPYGFIESMLDTGPNGRKEGH
jgi:hypothetical protein